MAGDESGSDWDSIDTPTPPKDKVKPTSEHKTIREEVDESKAAPIATAPHNAGPSTAAQKSTPANMSAGEPIETSSRPQPRAGKPPFVPPPQPAEESGQFSSFQPLYPQSPKNTYALNNENDFLFKPKNYGRNVQSATTKPLPPFGTSILQAPKRQEFIDDGSSMSELDDSSVAEVVQPKKKVSQQVVASKTTTVNSDQQKQRGTEDKDVIISFPVFPEERPRKILREFNSIVGYSCNLMSIPVQAVTILLLHTIRFVLRYFVRVLAVDVPNVFMDQLVHPFTLVVLTPFLTALSNMALGLASALNSLFIPFINVVRAFRLVNVEIASETVTRYHPNLK